jgi:hypothetical protein
MSGFFLEGYSDLHELAQKLNNKNPPKIIEYKKEGKFFTVLKRTWS